MSNYRIPLNKPGLAGDELWYIAEAISRGHSAGDGFFTKRSQLLLEQALSAKKALLTTSCTDALELAALLLDIKPGDEVIVPSFTFVSTINAFVLRGAVPVFIDIRPDTLNMDERKLEPLITQRTRAILPVHYAGVGCEMDAIADIASRHSIPVVEDNAHGLLGTYKGKMLGTFGCLAALSFHETKNIICGEGGALIVNDSQYSSAPRSCARRGPIAAASSAARSTNTPGSMWVQVFCHPTFWRLFSAHNWSAATKFNPNGATSGCAIASVSRTGWRSMAWACHSARPTVNNRFTCFICCSRR